MLFIPVLWFDAFSKVLLLEALLAVGYSTGRLSLDKVAVDSTTLKAGKEGAPCSCDQGIPTHKLGGWT